MNERYDIVVVGGGIHGVGVAQAAAAHGYAVLLLEQDRLAAGTSSRSSKLVHGGLRYLAGGHLGLVRECLRERELLLRLAPGLVRRRTFLVPVYRASHWRPWQLRAGLTLYALLAGASTATRFARVPGSEWDDLDGLRTDDLRAVYRYTDGQTDDAALTRAVMRSAMSLGATLAMPARFAGARIEPGAREHACTVDYRCGAESRTCRAHAIVNAAGPWAHAVLREITPAVPRRPVALVQGAHIVLPGAVERGIYYLESPRDRRVVFVMPWKEDILVGTTETVYEGDPADVRPLDDEQDYLAEVYAHHFPGRASGDVTPVSAFAGLRVLPAAGASLSARSRETILDVDDPRQPRLLTIYGGKLTAYRATAERVVRRLRPALPRRAAVADTRELPLTADETDGG